MFTMNGPPVKWDYNKDWRGRAIPKTRDKIRELSKSCPICFAKQGQRCIDDEGYLLVVTHREREGRLNDIPGWRRKLGENSESRRRALAKRGLTSNRDESE